MAESGTRVSLIMKQLRCQKRTEGDEDEIYVVVAGKTSSGKEIAVWMPKDQGHWDSIEHGSGRSITGAPLNFREKGPPPNQSLWSDSLVVGESVELTIFVMEQDGNDSKDILDMAAEAARTTDPEDPTVIGTNHYVPGLLKDRVWNREKGNSDDVPGVIALRITNTGERMEVVWVVRDRVRNLGPEGDARRFELNGDGSRYQLLLKVH
jgi:Domain of unknown function (DUF5590)